MYFQEKKQKVTTTCDPKLYKQAKDMKLPFARALEFGIRHMLGKQIELPEGESIVYQDPEVKLKRCVATMQSKIDELNEELYKQ